MTAPTHTNLVFLEIWCDSDVEILVQGITSFLPAYNCSRVIFRRNRWTVLDMHEPWAIGCYPKTPPPANNETLAPTHHLWRRSPGVPHCVHQALPCASQIQCNPPVWLCERDRWVQRNCGGRDGNEIQVTFSWDPHHRVVQQCSILDKESAMSHSCGVPSGKQEGGSKIHQVRSNHVSKYQCLRSKGPRWALA